MTNELYIEKEKQLIFKHLELTATIHKILFLLDAFI